MISRILLIYSSKKTPKQLLDDLKPVTRSFQKSFPEITIEWEDIDKWDEQNASRVVNDIRESSARFKYRVRGKGVGPLALSGSGQLNVSNTPIACLFDENDSLVFVLPSAKGPRHAKYDHIQTLNDLASGSLSLDDLISGATVEEKDIMTILRWYPHLLEPNLTFKDWEVSIDGGRIDLIFIDQEQNHLLVEVEITVTDQALGQVLRFREPYARKMGLPIEKVRLGLVGIDVKEKVMSGVKGLVEVPITLYQFKLDPIIDNYKKRSVHDDEQE